MTQRALSLVVSRSGAGPKGPQLPGNKTRRGGAAPDGWALFASAPSATVAVLRGSASLAPALPGLIAAAARGSRIIR